MTTPEIIGIIIAGLILYRLLYKKSIDQKQTLFLIANLTTKDFVEKYNKKAGEIKGGSLCFYGHWFGRPYDNYHQLELAKFDGSTNTLTLVFNEQETLTILNPQDIHEFENRLTIGSADHIYWKWFSYGCPQTEDNLYFIEISRQDNSLTGKTNFDLLNSDFKDLNVKKTALLWT